MQPEVWNTLPEAEKAMWIKRFRDERRGIGREHREKDWSKDFWVARDQYRVENALMGCAICIAVALAVMGISVVFALGIGAGEIAGQALETVRHWIIGR